MMGNAMWDSGWWGFGWGLHWVVPLIFIALVVWVVVTMLRGTPSAADRAKTDALAILMARYAKGELDKEQYEQMRRDIA